MALNDWMKTQQLYAGGSQRFAQQNYGAPATTAPTGNQNISAANQITPEYQTTKAQPGILGAYSSSSEPAVAQANYQTFDPTLRTVQSNELVQEQLRGVLAEDSPLLRQARARSNEAMQGMGLLNSSMANSAALEAVTAQGLNIAAPDAATYGRAASENQGYQNRAGEFGADAYNKNQIANTGYLNDRGNVIVRERGMDRRLDVTEGGMDRRLAVTEGGEDRRLGVREGGMDRRLDVTEGGQDRRLAVTERGSMDRLNIQEAGQTSRQNSVNDTNIRTTGMNNDTSIRTTGMNNATQIQATQMNNDTSRYSTDVGASSQRYATDVGASTQRYTADSSAKTQRDVAQVQNDNAQFLQRNRLASDGFQNSQNRIALINANPDYDKATRERLVQNEINGSKQAIELAKGVMSINLAIS